MFLLINEHSTIYQKVLLKRKKIEPESAQASISYQFVRNKMDRGTC